jgi:hypothetical protein
MWMGPLEHPQQSNRYPGGPRARHKMLCAVVDGGGNVLTSTDPAGGAQAWNIQQLNLGYPLRDISCPSISLCVAFGEIGGSVVSSTNPTGSAAAWTATQVDPESPLTSLACPSPSFCIASDQNGRVLIGTGTGRRGRPCSTTCAQPTAAPAVRTRADASVAARPMRRTVRCARARRGHCHLDRFARRPPRDRTSNHDDRRRPPPAGATNGGRQTSHPEASQARQNAAPRDVHRRGRRSTHEHPNDQPHSSTTAVTRKRNAVQPCRWPVGRAARRIVGIETVPRGAGSPRRRDHACVLPSASASSRRDVMLSLR